MAEQEKRKGAGGKLSRSETVTVRLDPKLRYLAELAARKQRRTVSSFIEWAVETSLKSVELYSGTSYTSDPSLSVADEGNSLWDVDEAERFVKLAIRYPELMTLEEQERWKMLSDADLLGPARTRTQLGALQWNFGRLDDVVYPTIRRIWPDLLAAHAAGPERSREWVASTRLAVSNGNIYPGYPPKPVAAKAGRPSSSFDDMDDEIPF